MYIKKLLSIKMDKGDAVIAETLPIIPCLCS